jgi:TrpR-related protein YerC/YecD
MRENDEKGGEINWNKKENKQLADALLSMKNDREMKCFLRDLMTEVEIEEFARRLEAARLLTKNVQYCEIIEKTGLSSTTIARISKWLKGPLGGYRLVLNKLGHTHSQNSIGKRLPLH